jgi:hypothetical protein
MPLSRRTDAQNAKRSGASRSDVPLTEIHYKFTNCLYQKLLGFFTDVTGGPFLAAE